MSKLDCKKNLDTPSLLGRITRLAWPTAFFRWLRPNLLSFLLMKTILTSSFLIVLACSHLVARASSNDPERPTPSVGTLAGGGIKASPLVRYLAATLQLSQTQTLAVQEAVQKHPRQARTPELLAQRLRTVLTTSEFERFEQLHNNADSATSLRELALR